MSLFAKALFFFFFVDFCILQSMSFARPRHFNYQRNDQQHVAQSKSRKKNTPIPVTKVPIEHLTTHEKHVLRPDLPYGRFSKKQTKTFSHLMRCHHTGKTQTIHSDLISLIYQIGKHYPKSKMWIIAGYRAPEVALAKGNPKSPHQKGIAADIRVDGIPSEELRDYVRSTFHPIGVGYYPNSDFVHIDVSRKKNAYWIDASSPGQRAYYIPAELKGKKLFALIKKLRRYALKNKRKKSLSPKHIAQHISRKSR